MHSLPVWALWAIAIGVWFIPGLGLFLADPIGRFLGRKLRPQAGGAPHSALLEDWHEPSGLAGPPG